MRQPELARANMQWAMSGPGHAVHFYDNDDAWQQVVVPFLADGLTSGQPLVILATDPHSHRIIAGLTERGFGTDALVGSGQILLLDAMKTLDRILQNGRPDPALFIATVGAVLEFVGARRRVVRAYGELVDVLCRSGRHAAAIQLEELWNAAAVEYHFALLCAYAAGSFCSGEQNAAFESICGEHHRVVAGPGRLAPGC
jgi:hypothetical protein